MILLLVVVALACWIAAYLVHRATQFRADMKELAEIEEWLDTIKRTE